MSSANTVQMKAVKRFKTLLTRKRPELLEGIFGRGSRIVAPPGQLRDDRSSHSKLPVRQSRSHDTHDRKPLERALVTEGIHHDLEVSEHNQVTPALVDPAKNSEQAAPGGTDESAPSLRQDWSQGRSNQAVETATHKPSVSKAQTFSEGSARGHAHDPLTDTLFLDIGTGFDQGSDAPFMISESPTGTEENVYEVAYKGEMDRILERRGRAATLFLTRRVEHRPELRTHENVIGQHRSATFSGIDGSSSSSAGGGGGGLANLVKKAKKAQDSPEAKEESDDEPEEGEKEEDDDKQSTPEGFASLVQKAKQASSKEESSGTSTPASGDKDDETRE